MFARTFLALVTVDVQATSQQAPMRTRVRFSASTDIQDNSTVRYRFRQRRVGGEFQIIRDFGPDNTLDWTSVNRDGPYEIEVTAQDLVSGETSVKRSAVGFDSLLESGKDTVSPTGHPLVFVFSTPACKAGGRVRVLCQTGNRAAMATPYQSCAPTQV